MKCRRTRLKSEVNYSEKDSYPKDTRQKEGGGQTKKNWREMFKKMLGICKLGFRVIEYPLSEVVFYFEIVYH